MTLRHRMATGVALLLTAMIVPSAAMAGFTTWAATSAEPSVFEILDDMYGLHNLERIHDYDATQTDQVWINTGLMNVSLVAKYSRMTQHFGFIAGETDMVSTTLMTASGNGQNFDESASFDVGASGEKFRFGNDPIGDLMGSSRQSDNVNGTDQMISWRVIGNDGFEGNAIGSMIVAFEDRPLRSKSADYNDLIVHVRRGEDPGDDGGTEPVPEPATLLLLGMGAAGLAASRRKRAR